MKLTKIIIFKCLVVKFLDQKNPYFNSYKNIHYREQEKKKRFLLILHMLDRNTITIPERNFIPIRLTEGEDHSLTNVDLECLVESEQVPAGRQKAITKLSREG